MTILYVFIKKMILKLYHTDMNLSNLLFKFLTAIAVFIAPIQAILISVSVLIIADTITGIWAALVKGDKFSSNKFFSSISKLIMYTTLILVSHMVELHLVSVVPWVQISVYFIIFYEFSSFLENVGIIVGRDIFAFFKESLNNLKNFKTKK